MVFEKEDVVSSSRLLYSTRYVENSSEFQVCTQLCVQS